MRLPKYLRLDKRRTSMYYAVTGVFAVVLMLAAIAVFRSPSETKVVDAPVVQTNEATGTREGVAESKENIPPENTEKVSNLTAEELKNEEFDIQQEIDADDNPEVNNDHKVDESVKTDEKPKDEQQLQDDAVDEKETVENEPSGEKKEDKKEDVGFPEELPTGNQTELMVENKEAPTAWTSQANESKEEKKQQEEIQQSPPVEGERQPEVVTDKPEQEKEAEQASKTSEKGSTEIYDWKPCDFPNAADYIPCLDNKKALKHLKSTKHYEHRERHCPTGEDIPKCLVPLPQGYQAHINWPQSRNQVWYNNVPHPGLVSYKKDQNWVKKKDDLLIFPGGGTQFKQGARRYIDFIEISVPAIAWGKHTRVVLDVGCGVASFGGYLFDKNVLTMSFAPKDEHDAQVQLALERGIPAILAVMGTQRLVYPSNSFDVVHCARCRVPWHMDGGKLLLELNRVLRPGGYFVWSATPVYKHEQEDVDIWKNTKDLMDSICWKMLVRKKDPSTGVGIAIFQKPTSNSCYEKRQKDYPPLCDAADNPDAAWYVPMQSCLHRIPVGAARGTNWPQDWPQRVNATPQWLSTIPKGLFGKPAAEEFQADTEHWHHVIEKSYAHGLEIDWSVVRNVMDMKAGYGGFAAGLAGYPVWVMNVVPTNEPDTLPIIYDRGLFGLYHDWCESFSTYPRTYDLLHADHLFSGLSKRCGILNTIVEMDRILRPGGWVIFRDTTTMLNEVEPLIRSLHWVVRVSYTQDQEQLLTAQKEFWRPPTI